MTMIAPPGVVDLAIDRALGAITATSVRVRLVSSVRAAIDALDEGRVQTVGFAARRMLCLHAVMRQHGLAAPTSGEVVSDRFLEVLPDLAWRGRIVLLVDDSRITGTNALHLRVVSPDCEDDRSLILPFLRIAIGIRDLLRLAVVHASDDVGDAWGTHVPEVAADIVEVVADAAALMGPRGIGASNRVRAALDAASSRLARRPIGEPIALTLFTAEEFAGALGWTRDNSSVFTHGRDALGVTVMRFAV